MNHKGRSKYRVGVLVPFTNTNLEGDLTLLNPQEIGFHYARLGGYDVDEIPDAGQMAGLGQSDLEEPLRMIRGVRPHVVMYGCTSATLALGPAFDRHLAERIDRESGAKTVTAAGALVHALQMLNVSKIGFASPYVPALNNDAIGFLADCGFETVSRKDVLEPLDNYGQGEISPEEVLQLGLEADSSKAEAIVLSCTDMRAVEIIEDLEQQTGKPVVSSNQAMLFQAMGLLGCTRFGRGFGQLFEHLN